MSEITDFAESPGRPAVNPTISYIDKLLLRKRAVIESVNDFLKNTCQIEHSKYRSVTGFFINKENFVS